MAEKMSKKEKQALSNYVRHIADMLWLRDWDFDIFFGEPGVPARSGDDQEWGASIEQTRHRQHACITLAEDFRTNIAFAGERGKQTIAHELIHMHWVRCWDMVRVDLLDSGGVSQAVYDVFVASYERNMEYGVDALAYAFAEHMPEIDWEFTKKTK